MKERKVNPNKSETPDRREPEELAPANSTLKPDLSLESLEPRILLSETWTGTAGDHVFAGTNDADDAHGLDGNDEIHGDADNDLLHGDGGGNDTMDGGQSFTINCTNVKNVLTGAGNSAPDAVDDSISTNEDAAITTGSVLTNDADPDGDTLSISSFTHGSEGTVADNGDGTFTYTPNANFNGNDSFTYAVEDGNVNTDTATVAVTVVATNDDPSASAGADQSVDESTTVTLDASASSDLDGDALTYTWTQTGGPAVNLSDASAAQPTFDTPAVSNAETLTFKVEVSDGQSSSTDTIDVVVNPVEASPPPPPPPAPPAPTPDPAVEVVEVEAEVVEEDAVESDVVEDSVPADTEPEPLADVVEPPVQDSVVSPAETTESVPEETDSTEPLIEPSDSQQSELADSSTGVVEEVPAEDGAAADDGGAMPVYGNYEPADTFASDSENEAFAPGDAANATMADVFQEVEPQSGTDVNGSPFVTGTESTSENAVEASQRVEDRHFDEQYEELVQGPREVEQQTGEWAGHNPEGLSGADGADSAAAPDGTAGKFGSFLAGLWGAVRGLGGTGKRSGEGKTTSGNTPRRR